MTGHIFNQFMVTFSVVERPLMRQTKKTKNKAACHEGGKPESSRRM